MRNLWLLISPQIRTAGFFCSFGRSLVLVQFPPLVVFSFALPPLLKIPIFVGVISPGDSSEKRGVGRPSAWPFPLVPLSSSSAFRKGPSGTDAAPILPLMGGGILFCPWSSPPSRSKGDFRASLGKIKILIYVV